MAFPRRPLALWLLYDMARDKLTPNADIKTIRHVMSFLYGYELRESEVEELLKNLSAIHRVHKYEAKRVACVDRTDLDILEKEQKKSKKQQRIEALITKTVRYTLSYKHKINSS